MDKFSLVQPEEYVRKLFEEHCSCVCKYVLMLRNEKDIGEAEDATQEAFIRALEYVESSGEELYEPLAWLKKVAARHYIRSIKDRRKRPEESLDWLLSKSGEDTGPIAKVNSISNQLGASPEDSLEDKENAKAIIDKLKTLPEGVIRDVMLLMAQGDTVAEVSQKIERQPSSVRVYLARGRKLLKDLSDEK